MQPVECHSDRFGSSQSDRGSYQADRAFEVDNGPSQTTKVLVWLAWGPVRPIWGSLYSTSRPSLLTAALSNDLLFQVERCGPEKFCKKHFKKCFKNARGVHVAIKGSVATPAPPPYGVGLVSIPRDLRGQIPLAISLVIDINNPDRHGLLHLLAMLTKKEVDD